MNFKITVEMANKILVMLELQFYTVTDIYEQSFRAIRINEYNLSELNAELMMEPELINGHNVWTTVSTATHVLRRFK